MRLRQDLAAPLPIIMIGDMLGVAPEDRDNLLRWSDDMLKALGAPDPALMDNATTAFVEYTDYIHPVFDDRRATHNTSDLVGVLCHAGSTAIRSTTTRSSTRRCSSSSAATRRPATSSAAAWRSSWPTRTRWPGCRPTRPGSCQGRSRRCCAGCRRSRTWPAPRRGTSNWPGRSIRAGQEVLLLYPSANRDEAVFEDAECFDIARSPNPHMAFGFGAHFCLGNQLARLELRVMVERVLARMPDLRLATPRDALPRRAANFISGIEEMPVDFTPSAPLGVGSL